MFLRKNCKSSFLICHLLFIQPRQSLKSLSYLPLIQRKSVLCKSKYELIYDFPLIKFPVAFARSRYSVSIATVILVPFLLLYSTKVSAVICLVSAGFHYGISALSSKFSQNIVGKIYVNKEGHPQEVIISSVDKFGRRIDRIHKPDEFINCDYYSKFSKYFGFIRLYIENSDIHYKINIRSCKIHNPEMCNYLLGKLWIVRTIKDVKCNQ